MSPKVICLLETYAFSLLGIYSGHQGMKIISFYSDQIYQDFFPLGFGWVLYIYIYEMRQKHNGTNCKHIQLECWGHMQQIRSWMPRYGVY